MNEIIEMDAKTFYKDYEADDTLSDLSHELTAEILKYGPESVLEFGCGTGKNLSIFHNIGIKTIGIDISEKNIEKATAKRLPFLIHGDEENLKYFQSVDVVFTCSCLDHIEDVAEIIKHFKRIANRAVILAETNDYHVNHYFRHDYERLNFEQTSFSWVGEDQATYRIWKWEKQELPGTKYVTKW